MKHHASPDFWKLYRKLPAEIQALADRAFALLKSKPDHTSLHLKKIDEVWSVRVGLHYRALGTDTEDGILWFWIGSHAEYDRLVS